MNRGLSDSLTHTSSYSNIFHIFYVTTPFCLPGISYYQLLSMHASTIVEDRSLF